MHGLMQGLNDNRFFVIHVRMRLFRAQPSQDVVIHFFWGHVTPVPTKAHWHTPYPLPHAFCDSRYPKINIVI